MGSLISLLQNTYSSLRLAFKTIASLNHQYQELIARTRNPPPAPVTNPTIPYWHTDPPYPELVDVRHDLPAEADVVIIGSGITGAAAAWTLMERSPTPLRIVVIEARQLCSGATGRNGGHVKCTAHEVFNTLKQSIGERKAAKVTRFQMRHLEILKQVGEQVPEAQVREVETVDFFVTEKEFEEVKQQIKVAKEWLPEFECDVWDAKAAKTKFGASDFVVGATSHKAGAAWPYRLVTGVWNQLLKRDSENLFISTHTTVEGVTTDTSSTTYIHRVKTSKGVIGSKHVLHATNGYAPYLVPSLIGRLSGACGVMTAQRPGDDFPMQTPERSWGIAHEPDFEYITQLRPDEQKGEKQGLLMVGGAFVRSQKQGMDTMGNWDDGAPAEPLITMVLGGCMETVFGTWGRGGGIVSTWTGILGMTGDSLPFVGRIGAQSQGRGKPDKTTAQPGQWVCAGYTGEGMVMAWLSATAVALMMLGLEDDEHEGGNGMPAGKLDDWFPREEFGMDEKRMKRADLANLIDDRS